MAAHTITGSEEDMNIYLDCAAIGGTSMAARPRYCPFCGEKLGI